MAVDIETIGVGFETSGLIKGRQELEKTGAAANKTADAADKLTDASGKTSTSFRALESTAGLLRGALAGLGISALASQYLRMADAVTLMDARLKLAVGSGVDFAKAQQDIYQIAQRNAVGIESVASLYTKLNDPIRQLGGTTAEVSAITEAFATSLKVSGASAAEASAATMQFAQAMASGALRGDEFNSIAEQNPRFMKALAQGMGVAQGALREMAADGELTADVVGTALIGSLETLRREGGSIPLTVGAAMQQLGNDALVLVGSFDKVTGGSGTVADMMVRVLTPAMKGVYSVAVGVVSVFQTLGKALGGVGAAIVAIMNGDFGQVRGILTDMSSDIQESWSRAGSAITSVWAETSATAERVTADATRLNKVTKQGEDGAKARASAERALTQAMKERAAIAEKIASIEEKAIEAASKDLAGLIDGNASLREEIDLIGASDSVRRRAVITKNQDVLATRELELVMAKSNGQNQAFISALEQEIELRKQRIKLLGEQDQKQFTQDAIEANEKAAKAAQEEWNKTWDSVGKSLSDALMRGFEDGKGFGQNFVDTLENMIKTQIASALQQSIAQGLSSLIGFGGNGGGALGMTNNASSLVQMFSGGGSNFGAVSGWATGGMSTANALGSIYANTVTAGMTTGSIAASGAGIDALLATNAAYGTAATGAGAASGMAGASSALSAIPVWGWVAIAAMALWEPLFGRKLKEVGLSGKFDGSGGVETQQYQFYKGGLFRSDKTKYSDLNDGGAFESTLRLVQDSAATMATALGLSADAVMGYADEVKVNLKGLSAEEAAAKMQEEMITLQAKMLATAEVANMSADSFTETSASLASASVESEGLKNALAGLGGEQKAFNDAVEKYKELIYAAQEAMASAGITAQALGDVLLGGMTGRLTEAQVGEQLADIVLGGIYDTIASPFADQIASAFQAQIVQPIFTAIMAGAPIAGAVSQSAIASVVATAQNAAAQLKAIFSNEEFQAAVREIYSAISQISSIAVAPARALPRFNSAVKSTVSTVNTAADQIKRAFEGIVDSLTDEIRRLRGNLLGEADAAASSWYWSQFATLTASARSGNQDAAKQLTDVSRTLEQIAENTALSLSDLNVTRGSLMASLTETRRILAQKYGITVPAFATGTNYVTQDMLAYVHKGEAIVPRAYNPAADGGSASSAEVVAELRELRRTNERQAAAATIMAAKIAELETGMRNLSNGYNALRSRDVTPA